MIRCVDIRDRLWEELYNRLPDERKDIYFSSGYYECHEKNKDGKGKCIIYQEENRFVLYPFLLNPIPKYYELKEEFYDIETANGYGGPVSNSDEPLFLERFEEQLNDWMFENHIVAEFIKFHPLMDNTRLLHKNIQVFKDRQTIYCDLEIGSQEIWRHQLSKGCKAAIKQAENQGVYSIINRDFETFQTIYKKTMDRLGSTSYYYFSEAYFDMMSQNKDCVVLNAMKEDTVIASCILMVSGDYVHYHLSGSQEEYLYLRPNNFMLWKAIEYCEQVGRKKLHLGGGRTNQVDDSLYKFKKSFSDKQGAFCIGKRIHHQEVYKQLIEAWQQANPDKRQSLLLQYKYND